MRKIGFRILTFILFLIFALFVGAGCDVSALIGLETNRTSTSDLPGTNLSADLSSDDPQPSGSLPQTVINSLGTGFQADNILAMAGVQVSQTAAGHYRIYVTENREIICDLQVIEHAGIRILKTAIQNDITGHKLLFAPTPDSQVIDDFQLIAGNLILKTGASGLEANLLQDLGKPLRTGTEIENSISGQGEYLVRTFSYRDLTVELTQKANTPASTVWQIGRITCTNANFISQRGLKTGLSYKAVLKMFGTGDFILRPDILPVPASLVIMKVDDVNSGITRQMELFFEDDIVSSISISMN
jgi:hypothetical protein